ncbi:hypothetical protein MHBO_002588, partial [Bonamia ostreae]
MDPPVNDDPKLGLFDFKKFIHHDKDEPTKLMSELQGMDLTLPTRKPASMHNVVRIAKEKSLDVASVNTPVRIDSTIDAIYDSVCVNVLHKMRQHSDCLRPEIFNEIGLRVDMYNVSIVLDDLINKMHNAS